MCWSLQSNPGTENNISCHILFVGTARHPDRVACKTDRCAAPRYRAVFFMWFVQCDGRDCLQDANSFRFFERLVGDYLHWLYICRDRIYITSQQSMSSTTCWCRHYPEHWGGFRRIFWLDFTRRNAFLSPTYGGCDHSCWNTLSSIHLFRKKEIK